MVGAFQSSDFKCEYMGERYEAYRGFDLSWLDPSPIVDRSSINIGSEVPELAAELGMGMVVVSAATILEARVKSKRYIDRLMD